MENPISLRAKLSNNRCQESQKTFPQAEESETEGETEREEKHEPTETMVDKSRKTINR